MKSDFKPKPKPLNPKPEILNTLNPKPETLKAPRYEALRDRSFKAVAVCMVDGGPEYEAPQGFLS